MPRLPPSLLWRARREISPMATLLLLACRDLQSAANELRWICEHVRDTRSPIPPGLRVWQLCEKRGQGVPLQYVLGTQPFGHLDIKCRPGVLIPRPETEAYTLHLASLLTKERGTLNPLSILDLCTGTGCIPLLLTSLLLKPPNHLPIPPRIAALGIDISPKAISLARQNHHHNARLGHLPPPAVTEEGEAEVAFYQADIFSPTFLQSLQTFSSLSSSSGPSSNQTRTKTWDLLTANPPYISPRGFATDTARSVRNHEPKTALVPGDGYQHPDHYGCRPEDAFYARILEIAQLLSPRPPRRVLLEVGGWEQAVRVVTMALAQG
ncbi:S-adenosyl-L-methionine-dependent methyltransferase, partial [Canariomyces notabilis]